VKRDLLQVRGLEVRFATPAGPIRAVDRVDLTLAAGERFGLVGESGSGKTTLLLALLRMVREPGRIVGGQVLLDGVDLLHLEEEEIRQVRLARIAMVPQGALNSLNPLMRIGDQITLSMREHGQDDHPEPLDRRTAHLLEQVGLRPEVARRYPHELSGGMKQRACIAIAISLGPRLILADEPTSALDVVVQRRIMQTLGSLQEGLGATVLLVGHEMGLMAQFAERVGVMYGGRLVEVGPVAAIFGNPRHPYTRMLIASVPSLSRRGEHPGIPGTPVSLLEPPGGCLFHPRCPCVLPQCSRVAPDLRGIAADQQVACFLGQEEPGASAP
jgi:peptide/nickel transport system ATP-binding protein